MENTTFSEEFLLNKLNDSTVLTIIPVIVYVAVLMIMGVLGNSFVCYFYIMKTSISSNVVFIATLAIYDLTMCCVAIPLEILDLRFFYVYISNAACKIGRFVNTLGAIGSSFTLIIIAWDRFRKICRPDKKQMDVNGAKLAIAISTVVSMLLSSPALLVYKRLSVEIFNEDGVKLQGFDCTTVRSGTFSKLVSAFNALSAIGFLVIVVILIVMYSLLSRSIYKTKKNTHGQSGIDQSTLRYTKMTLVITVTYILSFLPYLILAIWRTLNTDYEGETMGKTALVAFNIGIRSYFMNSAINPFIYGLYNPKFKRFILNIICPCRQRDQ